MKNKLDTLIDILCAERGESTPDNADNDKLKLFRALVNVRMPREASKIFLQTHIEKRSICIDADMGEVLAVIKQKQNL